MWWGSVIKDFLEVPCDMIVKVDDFRFNLGFKIV